MVWRPAHLGATDPGKVQEGNLRLRADWIRREVLVERSIDGTAFSDLEAERRALVETS